VRDFLEHAALKLALGLANRLPEPAARRLGRGLGRAAHGLGIRTAVARANVDRALGASHSDAERRAVVRAAYAHLGESLVEFLALQTARPESLRTHVDLQGEDHIQAALAAGRGAIMASGHLGNWEVMSAGAAARGYPMTFVVQPLRNTRADALVDGLRKRCGIEVLQRGMALRRVEDALAANRLVFFMCDQDARRRGVFVPFFGVPASTPKGAAQLAIRHRVPFLPAFGWRLPMQRHVAVFGPPIAVPAGDEEAAVRTILAEFNARLEAAVLGAPEQYWWAHRRWKTRPPA
jgi:Kdo2-lipid IVA lauroyltransferase/acyltransferase